MGCWGITAFESDAGLDSVDYIRRILPQGGKLDLGEVIEALRKDDVRLPDVRNAESHTSPMALAEIMVKFLDQDIGALDYDEDWAAKDNKFSGITSFIASKESLQWIRGYLSDTLRYTKEEERAGHKWGGWFKQKDWITWQEHMTALIGRLDSLMAAPGDQLELISPRVQEQGPVMGQN